MCWEEEKFQGEWEGKERAEWEVDMIKTFYILVWDYQRMNKDYTKKSTDTTVIPCREMLPRN